MGKPLSLTVSLVSVCLCVFVWESVFVYVCVFVWESVFVYVCVCVCVCVCVWCAVADPGGGAEGAYPILKYEFI